MSFVGVVFAGCAPGTSECADQTAYPILDNWFVVLVLVLVALLVLAVVAGGARFVRHRSSRRFEVPAVDESGTGAEVSV
jgi:hypothetical protein